MITTDLLLKGLGGVVTVGSGGGLFVFYQLGYFFNQELIELGEKIGLDCRGAPTDTIGVQCFKKGGGEGIKVKRGREEFNLTDLPAGDSGIIMAYLRSGDEGYNKNFKFLIEGGDIEVENNKLEEFETYEIKEENEGSEDWKLIRKNDAKTEIKKALGLGDGCDLPKENGCDLDLNKFKAINFEGKEEGVMSLAESTKLKITTEDNKKEYPLGYKFVLESSGETKISREIILENGTNTEFRINKKGRGLLSLERRWTVNSLGEKVGLKCRFSNKKGGVCSLVDGSINVKNGDNKFSELHVKEGSENSLIRFGIEEGEHNQGFKFYAEEEVVLEDGEKNVKDNQKIEAKGNDGTVSYEIKKDTDKWYLTKKE